MFGHNTLTGQSYFKDAGDKLMVTSIFMTLQGEGPYRGEPAVFVRLSRCNLTCWFCDTYFDDGEWMTIAEIESRVDQTIKSYFSGAVPLWAQDFWGGVAMEGEENLPQSALKKKQMVFVLTGGEPMLQKNIVPLLERMNRRFAKTQIESNGIIVQPVPAETTLVVSPKCSQRDHVPVKYLEPKKEMLDRADCLKFVMTSDTDSPYNTVPDWALDWKNRTGKPIFVSPMNVYNREPQKAKELRLKNNSTTLEQRSNVEEVISFWEAGLLDMTANQANHEYTAKYAVNNGLIFNMQLHLFGGLA